MISGQMYYTVLMPRYRLVKSVKSSGVFGGPAKTPTVVNPELYRHVLFWGTT